MSFFSAAPRVGSYSCRCGKVELDIVAPFSSWGVVEQASAICQCCDCVDFGAALVEAADPLLLPPGLPPGEWGTHLVNFYKSDLVVHKGAQHVKLMKLRPDSSMSRCFVTCCQTPFMAIADAPAPFVLLYRDLVRPQPRADSEIAGVPIPALPATVVLNHKEARERSMGAPDKATDNRRQLDIPIRQGVLDAPLFLLRIIARVFWGMFWGKGKTTESIFVYDPKTLPVGLDTLAANKKSQ